jgi:hypothetical protein
MDPAWSGVVGAGVGVAGVVIGTWITTRNSTSQAREERQAKRVDAVRELAVDGYIAAVEAVSWISTMHVEDYADPDFADEYVPKTAAAMAKLAEARQALNRVAALGANRELSEVGQETSLALAALADAWDNCANFRRKILAGQKSMWEMSFDKHYERLNDIRKRLCGISADLPHQELDKGQVLEGSLLHALRAATSSL